MEWMRTPLGCEGPQRERPVPPALCKQNHARLLSLNSACISPWPCCLPLTLTLTLTLTLLPGAGGLPEAGLGVCPVVRVEKVQVPLDDNGTPCWAARQYPRQQVRGQVAASRVLRASCPAVAGVLVMLAVLPASAGQAPERASGRVCKYYFMMPGQCAFFWCCYQGIGV